METNILTESRFDLDGRQINYAKGPKNGPPLLLIHGISGRWQDWGGVSEALSTDWQVYAVDLRGHGKSEWTPEGYHWRLYSQDQVEFLERVIGEPAHIIGHSLGGVTALGVNALRSDLVRAAVYEDPPLFVQRRWEVNHFRSSFTATLEVLDSKPDFQTLYEHVRISNPEYDDVRCRERTEKYLQMDPEVFRSTLSGRARANWRSEDLLQKAFHRAFCCKLNRIWVPRSTMKKLRRLWTYCQRANTKSGMIPVTACIARFQSGS